MKVLKKYYSELVVNIVMVLGGCAAVYAGLSDTETFGKDSTDLLILIGSLFVIVGIKSILDQIFSKDRIRYYTKFQEPPDKLELLEYKNRSLIVVDGNVYAITSLQLKRYKHRLENYKPVNVVVYYDKNKKFLSKTYLL